MKHRWEMQPEMFLQWSSDRFESSGRHLVLATSRASPSTYGSSWSFCFFSLHVHYRCCHRGNEHSKSKLIIHLCKMEVYEKQGSVHHNQMHVNHDYVSVHRHMYCAISLYFATSLCWPSGVAFHYSSQGQISLANLARAPYEFVASPPTILP